ncbi:MAG: Mur ligase domain-containing protein, partial [Mucinivorans sp.]
MKNIYFVGIGGIGMSALARFFVHEGYSVAGYDRISTPLTEKLENEGIAIHYSDSVALIPVEFRDPTTTRVIFTPAVKED